MATTINADNGVSSGSAGLKESADSSGVLALQTNGTTAVSISTGQVVTLTNALPAGSGGTGLTSAGASGNILTSNGTTWVSAVNAGAPAPVVTIYTSPATWTKPASVKGVQVFMVSAGGSGGAGIGGGGIGSGSGGGGGGTGTYFASAGTIPGPVSITIGTGGTAVTNGSPIVSVAGNSGGTTSFGAFFSITGGGGGGASTPGASSGGAGGVATPSPAIYAKSGYAGTSAGNGVGAPGGASAYFEGDGGAGKNTSATVPAPSGYGGGGGGCRPSGGNAPAGSSRSGPGGDGIVIVEEFY